MKNIYHLSKLLISHIYLNYVHMAAAFLAKTSVCIWIDVVI